MGPILLALAVALFAAVESFEHRREMDRAVDAHLAFLDQLGRGTGDH